YSPVRCFQPDINSDFAKYRVPVTMHATRSSYVPCHANIADRTATAPVRRHFAGGCTGALLADALALAGGGAGRGPARHCRCAGGDAELSRQRANLHRSAESAI